MPADGGPGAPPHLARADALCARLDARREIVYVTTQGHRSSATTAFAVSPAAGRRARSARPGQSHAYGDGGRVAIGPTPTTRTLEALSRRPRRRAVDRRRRQRRVPPPERARRNVTTPMWIGDRLYFSATAKASATSTRAVPTAATCAATPTTTPTTRARRRATAGASSTHAAPACGSSTPRATRRGSWRSRRRRTAPRRRAASSRAPITSNRSGSILPAIRWRSSPAALFAMRSGRRGDAAHDYPARRRRIVGTRDAAPAVRLRLGQWLADGTTMIARRRRGRGAPGRFGATGVRTLPWDTGTPAPSRGSERACVASPTIATRSGSAT